MRAILVTLFVVLVVVAYCDGATTKKTTTKKKTTTTTKKTTTKAKPKITATKKVLKTTTLKMVLTYRDGRDPMPVDPNATTPPPEYYYYEEDVDNPDYVTPDPNDVEEVEEIVAAVTVPPKQNETKHQTALQKYLYNLAQKRKKNGQRLINRFGRR